MRKQRDAKGNQQGNERGNVQCGLMIDEVWKTACRDLAATVRPRKMQIVTHSVFG
jgi:hypothetical protein